MSRLRFTSEALENLADIAFYIAMSTGSRPLAENFVKQITQKCGRLASLPGTLGRDRSELRTGLRSIVLKGYVTFFRYRDDIVEVVTVLEGHRDIDGYFHDEES